MTNVNWIYSSENSFISSQSSQSVSSWVVLMMGACMLTSAATTRTILLIEGRRKWGNRFERILKFFILWMARSTWILTDAIFLHVACSSSVYWWPLLPLGGIIVMTPSHFRVGKPLSASTISPGSRSSRIPESQVMNVSLVLSPYAFDTNVNIPSGAIPGKEENNH